MNQYERNVVKLVSSLGAKFTAYPTVQFPPTSCQSLDMRQGLGQGLGQGRGQGLGLGEDQNQRWGQSLGAPMGMFSRVRGVFPDRSQIDLCLRTKVQYLQIIPS